MNLRNGATQTDFYLYNSILLVSYIWLMYKNKHSSLYMLVITLFWTGLFSDMGKMVVNLQKIVSLGWSFALFVNNKKLSTNKHIKYVYLSIILFSIYFLFTTLLLHSDNLFLVLSQLSKYLIPFFIFIVLYFDFASYDKLMKFNHLMFVIIKYQIYLSIIKYFIIMNGFWYEGWVGSITGFSGGAAGTSFPLLALLLYCLNTDLQILNKKSYLFLFGLIFIGFAAGKRAIWFLFPLLLSIYSFFIVSKKMKLFKYLFVLVPVFIYIGLRATPTLNPENKVWGSFDVEYAYDYVLNYSLGKKEKSGLRKKGYGRVGAVTLISNRIISNSLTKEDYLGYGAQYMYAFDHDNYTNSDYFLGISSRGAITGILTTFIALGLIGVVLMINLLYSFVLIIPNRKLKLLLLIFQLFLYIYYVGSIISTPALFVFYLYIILFAYLKSEHNIIINEISN